ncbi:hypothetical protein BV25DRAFT_1891370 [Artomyces pyxidatus]|uniref:Uncharacterized protein n=1 Tax=Artomyces pyxidatus TaxID=48021 RepID=A0ACB8SRF4_9AGAM|nr:hypothetical protein BV25DRAFT_1891370 [Artomyces pyxidatus]
MVSADNLNFDVLEIIFSFLAVPDLASVSQVSRSFLAGVIPRLYRSLPFYYTQAKRYPNIMSPFAAVIAHPGLTKHVRSIDIRVVPNLRVKLKTLPDPRFLRDCIAALSASASLRSFTCTIANVIPPLLHCLQGMERLQSLRIHAVLTPDQTAKLVKLRGIRHLTLENPSWSVVDALPNWAEAMQSTLTHVTIYMSHDMNNTILKRTVAHLPKLRGLHIVGCQHVSYIDVLNATEHTPLLETLAFTTSDISNSPLPSINLTELKHLALDLSPACIPSLTATPTSPPALLPAIMALTRFTHLTSLALRLPSKQLLPDSTIEEIIDLHGTTLRSLRLMGCAVSIEGVESIADECERLERLVISIPVSEIDEFASSLASSVTLHTLIDHHDHGTHGPRLSLTTEPVRMLMEEVPSLTRVVSDSRCWTGHHGESHTGVKLERMKNSRGKNLWFTPPPEV